MQCSVYKSPKEQAKEDGKWNRSRVNFEKEKKTVVAKSVQDLFCMQTVPSDQHVWKYFLKTRKTRINLKSDFPLSLDQFKVLVCQSQNCSPSSLLNLSCLDEEAGKDPGGKYIKF